MNAIVVQLIRFNRLMRICAALGAVIVHTGCKPEAAAKQCFSAQADTVDDPSACWLRIFLACKGRADKRCSYVAV